MSDVPDILYNLDLEDHGIEEALREYARVIWETREIHRSVKRKGGKVLSGADITGLGLKSGVRVIVFTLRKEDVYLIGYKRIGKDDKVLELKSDSELLVNAKQLVIPVDYSSLTSCQFGWGVLKKAFNVIWKCDPDNEGTLASLHGAFQEIILMIIEAARFFPIFEESYEMIASRKEFVLVPEWIDDMVHSWKFMSDVATKPLPMTGIKIPDDFDSMAWTMYDDHDMLVFDPKIREEAPYFARLAICYPHIGGKDEHEASRDTKVEALRRRFRN